MRQSEMARRVNSSTAGAGRGAADSGRRAWYDDLIRKQHHPA
jgi:hypothetical protein